MDMACNGGNWAEGAAKMPVLDIPHERLDGSPLPIVSLGADIMGFAPMVPSYLAGIPEDMMTLDEIDGENRRLRIAVHVGRVNGTTQTQAFNRGAAIVAVLSQLALEGYQLQLSAIWRNTVGRDTANVETIIKDYADQFSAESVAFALCNLAFQRRLCWRVAESLTNGGANITNSSYGNGRRADFSDYDISYKYLDEPYDYTRIDNAVALVKAETLEQLTQLTSGA